MKLPAGARIGPYKIVAAIGAGGMGEVYRAVDPRLDREVAIKVLTERLAGDPDSLQRFEREAKAVAALSHPNILDIHDFGTDQGIAYAVMELLQGETLRQRIDRSPLPSNSVLEIAVCVAEGLAAAHSKGVIHRDLKPENIFLTSDGRVKILDFGLARYEPQLPQQDLTSAPTAPPATETGMVVGTAPYMSPEQARGGILDARSDIFSLGCVLYEMISGKRAFPGETPADIISAILTSDPVVSKESGRNLPPKLIAVTARCLKKNPDQRVQSAQDLLSALREIRNESLQPRVSAVRSRAVIAGAALLALLILAGVFWNMKRNARIRWARDEAIPEITRLADAENFVPAFGLARQAAQIIPNDPVLKSLWPRISRTITVHTVPGDAALYIKEYKNDKSEWKFLGRSPLSQVQIPPGLLRWKIQKDGFEAVECADGFPQFRNPTEIVTLNFTLDKNGSLPAGMLRVPGGLFELQIPGLDHLPAVQLDDYFIDRYEVTNRQFKDFVAGGGYQKREFWKQKFFKDGKEIGWDEAMAEFRDTTGRPGPATWEVGDYPKGQADFPVTGISWYEAVAYAEFAGKSLPTIYHWNRAAGTWDSAYVVPLSNFGGPGLTPVGSNAAIHHYGARDMAGNAKEWCWNDTGTKRFILGGAWNEPAYMFNDPDAQPPFSRLANYGFRCVKYLKPIVPAAAGPIEWAQRDYRKEKPVSDDVFRIYRSLFSYDKTPLNSVVESVDDSAELWRRERITFDAAYGKERVIAYLFIPKHASPPYQTVIYFPGSNVIYMRSAEDVIRDARNMARIDFVIQSGRAILYPVYKGTFERGDGLNSDIPAPTSFYRDHVIEWSKDFGRSIDYLETRKDVDSSKLAFYGASWGGAMGMIIPALEPRLKANVLLVGGFYMQKTLPEVDQVNFVSRVTIPTLMLNGRYDFFIPVETAQVPAFNLLGTPQKDKRQVFYDTGHDIPRVELIREVLNWLDRYLGPVKTH